MSDYLRRIYEGDIHLEEQMAPITEEYHQQRAKTQALETAFLKRLPADLQEEYARIVEARIKLTGIEVEEACVQGMREGAQIAVALLKKPKRDKEKR